MGRCRAKTGGKDAQSVRIADRAGEELLDVLTPSDCHQATEALRSSRTTSNDRYCGQTFTDAL